MEKTNFKLLLTRPKQQSFEFLEMCERHFGNAIHAHISPILQIVPKKAEIDFDKFEALIFSSRNGVVQVGKQLRGRKVFTVGEQTAQLARSFGACAEMLGKDAESLLANAGKLTGPILVCRGKHMRVDLAHRLKQLGFSTEDQVLYEQLELPLDEKAKSILAGTRKTILPLFSPRSAQLLSEYEISAPRRIIAISQATADAWRHDTDVIVAKSSDAASVCKEIVRLL